MRITPQLHESLERVARGNGRSLTQQAEFWMEFGARLESVMTIAPAR
jgi:hypothetical protein